MCTGRVACLPVKAVAAASSPEAAAGSRQQQKGSRRCLYHRETSEK
jgi:hypothetical protein